MESIQLNSRIGPVLSVRAFELEKVFEVWTWWCHADRVQIRLCESLYESLFPSVRNNSTGKHDLLMLTKGMPQGTACAHASKHEFGSWLFFFKIRERKSVFSRQAEWIFRLDRDCQQSDSALPLGGIPRTHYRLLYVENFSGFHKDHTQRQVRDSLGPRSAWWKPYASL